MAQRKISWKRVSLRHKVTFWFLAILVVLAATLGIVIAMGQTTISEFDELQHQQMICHDVQEAVKAERQAFENFIREVSRENLTDLETACAATRRAIDALPFDYTQIGRERYARTWNIRQGYTGYTVFRDQAITAAGTGADDVELIYSVMEMQEDLSDYALRLVQATVDQSSLAYRARADLFRAIPFFYIVLLAGAIVAVLAILRGLARHLVQPLLDLAWASRKIAENDFSIADIAVHSSDEMSDLATAFNRMKHAMRAYIATLEEKNRIARRLHREEMAKMELQQHLDQTRLEMLKSQVNPHFLFNTLNMISCMARLEDADTTNRMILSLSGLFRYNLRTTEQEVCLEQELEALDDYLYIQQMRFDGRVTHRRILRTDPARVRIPSFTLQPVVENAFVHGLASRESGGRITLRIWEQGGDLVVSIADNGRGMTPEALETLKQKIAASEQTGRGIGLGNICRRISMLYPGGSCRIHSRPGRGTVIQFVIPQNTER